MRLAADLQKLLSTTLRSSGAVSDIGAAVPGRQGHGRDVATPRRSTRSCHVASDGEQHEERREVHRDDVRAHVGQQGARDPPRWWQGCEARLRPQQPQHDSHGDANPLWVHLQASVVMLARQWRVGCDTDAELVHQAEVETRPRHEWLHPLASDPHRRGALVVRHGQLHVCLLRNETDFRVDAGEPLVRSDADRLFQRRVVLAGYRQPIVDAHAPAVVCVVAKPEVGKNVALLRRKLIVPLRVDSCHDLRLRGHLRLRGFPEK
mmetsp:Transcript_898/g.2144  ORF Transcript_898/g.2144 Transcript_898/m.2144 type:complete len:263 (+) Transcript_898:116-904(+)